MARVASRCILAILRVARAVNHIMYNLLDWACEVADTVLRICLSEVDTTVPTNERQQERQNLPSHKMKINKQNEISDGSLDVKIANSAEDSKLVTKSLHSVNSDAVEEKCVNYSTAENVAQFLNFTFNTDKETDSATCSFKEQNIGTVVANFFKKEHVLEKDTKENYHVGSTSKETLEKFPFKKNSEAETLSVTFQTDAVGTLSDIIHQNKSMMGMSPHDSFRENYAETELPDKVQLQTNVPGERNLNVDFNTSDIGGEPTVKSKNASDDIIKGTAIQNNSLTPRASKILKEIIEETRRKRCKSCPDEEIIKYLPKICVKDNSLKSSEIYLNDLLVGATSTYQITSVPKMEQDAVSIFENKRAAFRVIEEVEIDPFLERYISSKYGTKKTR